jgi:hypothetical protein
MQWLRCTFGKDKLRYRSDFWKFARQVAMETKLSNTDPKKGVLFLYYTYRDERHGFDLAWSRVAPLKCLNGLVVVCSPEFEHFTSSFGAKNQNSPCSKFLLFYAGQ